MRTKAVAHQAGDDVRTRERLIAAAGDVFAEVGFRDATVREICRRADANVAAVSYHFGDKVQLYSQTMRALAQAAIKRFPPDMGVSADSTAEEKLHAFVRSFVLRVLSDDRAAQFGRILAREFVEPTEALNDFVENQTLPMREILRSIITQLVPRNFGEDQMRRCMCSIVGQIVFYKHCRPIIDMVFPGGEKFDAASLDALAQHITSFSLSGIRTLANGKSSGAKR